MSKIKEIEGREILASGGSPSLEVTVTLESGVIGEASISYGASAGSKEAVVLLDGDKNRYNGKGMLKAVENINGTIKDSLVGMEASEQRSIDEKMIELDGTENKSVLGGNAILGVSLAVARAEANEEKLPLYKYLRKAYGIERDGWKLPRPMVVMIEGGKHANDTTDLQEFMIGSREDMSAAKNVRMVMEIYVELKKILEREGLSTNVGNEGAFAPSGIVSNEKAMEYLVEAMKNTGYEEEAGIGLDAAASEFYNQESKKYELKLEGKELSSDELIKYYESWMEKYPIIAMEDMLSEFDWDSWPKLVEVIDGKFPLISDDLTVTNSELLEKAIKMKAATAILIKLNQAGTLSETVDSCLLANKNNLMTMQSHRGGGESNDTFLVDLAVAVGSEYIKVGPTRGERVVKYNRLMRIEEELKLENQV